jgi:tRNA dimethylallyltransferase
MKKHKLIVISGPTAVGKTALAVAFAKLLNCPIISSDARQFYKEMCIGTAVPSEAEQQGVRHDFIQHLSIHDSYSVGDFEKDALLLLRKHFEKHAIVIMVGGSNLYNNAVVHGLDKFPEVSEKIKDHWQLQFHEKGLMYLQQELQKLDPDYFQTVDLNNHVRLLRALYICTASGKPYSSFLGQNIAQRSFDVISIEITMPREKLYENINKRVDVMIENGLIDEAKALHPYKHLNALQTVGYRELFRYFEGRHNLEEAVLDIKTNTRRFAKRQLTWLRNHPCIHKISYDSQVNKNLIEKLGLKVQV